MCDKGECDDTPDECTKYLRREASDYIQTRAAFVNELIDLLDNLRNT